MYILQLYSDNIAHNLATEEYLLKHKKNDFVLLYANSPCIVVGKHQNALSEINHRVCKSLEIPVVRRISGGGTVYHDKQNLNFSFLLSVDNNPVNFRKYSQPIVDFLNELGAEADFSPRNDIFIGDKKISGNAEHVLKQRVLHHGTLLFNSDLSVLDNVLNVRLERYQSKAIQSVRRRVANILDYLPQKISFSEFGAQLFKYLRKYHQAEEYVLSDDDLWQINQLVTAKYQTYEWNYGYSPKYKFGHSFIFADEPVKVSIDVEKGIIRVIELNTSNSRLDALKNLKNVKHLPEEIEKILAQTYDTQTTKFLVDNLV